MPDIMPQVFPLPKRACSDCAFRRRIGLAEGRELFADYPFADPARPMVCHYDGSEFNPAAREHRCVGFYRQAHRLGYDAPPPTRGPVGE